MPPKTLAGVRAEKSCSVTHFATVVAAEFIYETITCLYGFELRTRGSEVRWTRNTSPDARSALALALALEVEVATDLRDRLKPGTATQNKRSINSGRPRLNLILEVSTQRCLSLL